MVHNNSMSNSISKSSSKSISKTSSNKPKKDSTLQNIVNYSTLIIIVIIIYLVYKYSVENKFVRIRGEGFIGSENITNTIYESSINNIFKDNIRLKCSMLPSQQSLCIINNVTYVPYKFPVHIIKLINGSILAVFNDGRLYKKDDIASTIWAGPITNSKPLDIVPLRMITLATDLVTLLGVGYDNILYIKKPDTDGNTNLTIPWLQVPNNSSIIYVLYDNQTNFLLSIDIDGNLFTKKSLDITSNNIDLVTKLDRPILRLYYDLNGYMLVIDNKFDLYQFSDLNWKTTPLSIERGHNNSKIQDLLYDNDGKMYGLIFNPDAFMVQIMKQTSIFYLADFDENNIQLAVKQNQDFVMSDQDIIKCKIGSLYDYITNVNYDDITDDDTNFAYHKQLINNDEKLRNFCATRNIPPENKDNKNFVYDNYEISNNIDKNYNKIDNLKSIVNNLLSYEPDSNRIKEKYQIITS